MSGAWSGLYDAAWVFYALGPQLVLCLLFGYLAAKKTDGSRLDWMAGGFVAALVPIAGAIAMAWLWRRPPARLRRPAPGEPTT
jgi:hypothetical protein